ncbi:class I SAM-dependent methyltransferase [Bradyrhizobium macuxiense]|nr:class I SAM-dependent methyltransferase [Bradyrhizobium macuxiense]
MYFDQRAQKLLKKPDLSLSDVAYVSSRDYRVWPEPVYADMINWIAEALQVSKDSDLAEIGCAAGFVAYGLSAKARSYTGVDLSPACARLATRLRLPNAAFIVGDGRSVPLEDASVDRVLCTDVIVNIPDERIYENLIREMHRILRPGGKILLGNLNDTRPLRADFDARIKEYSAGLPPYVEDEARESGKWMPWHFNRIAEYRARHFAPLDCDPAVFHEPAKFEAIGSALGMETNIISAHKLYPYYGFRYSVVYTRAA